MANGAHIEIELENFKGPLALLLDLIEKHKLPINEISLSKVADDFVSKAKLMNFSKDNYAEFISISATLIYIKSKSLLPVEEREEDTESDELKRRLKALSVLKQESAHTGILYKNKRFIRLEKLKNIVRKKRKYKKPSHFILRHSQYVPEILKLIPDHNNNSIKITRKKVRSLEEVLKDIQNKLNEYAKIRFGDLSAKSKEDKVLTFLAVLELRRKGVVKIKQTDGEIEIEKDFINTPFYG